MSNIRVRSFAEALLLFLEEFLQVREALYGDVITLGLDFAPDRGGASNDFDVGGEGLDDNIALVPNLVQSADDRLPIDVVAPRCATIATARVEMAQELAGLQDRFGLVLFLDVHVEGIEVNLHGFAADSFHQLQRLVDRVEKIRLKAIQRLDAKLDAFALRVLSQWLEVLHHEIEMLFLCFVIVGANQTDNGIDRANDPGAAEDDRLINQPFDILGGSLLIRCTPSEVTARPHARADAPNREAILVGSGFHFRRIDVLERLDRDLDCIESPFLKLRKELHAFGRER